MSDPSSLLPGLRAQPERTPICAEIVSAIRRAIMDGSLEPDARLPSSRDLAAQLGVARGTVRTAFEQLVEEGLLVGAGAAGTRVTTFARAASTEPTAVDGCRVFRRPMEGFVPAFSEEPLPFQMGVPADDAFPSALLARLRVKAARRGAAAPASYPDPRGEPELRAQIASVVAIGRRLHCVPDQIVVTTGYRQGLALTLLALGAYGRSAWMEDPGFPIGRRALELCGMSVVPVAVDKSGLRVEDGIGLAGDAAVALVTPGQQAPLGVPLAAHRRRELLAWAAAADAWIIEDDYLSELQLAGRPAPALASEGGCARVVHVGSFSKTLSPSLGLGFLVVPPPLVDRFSEAAAMLMPAPDRTTQLAVAEFVADGHYHRHLRRMKALYARRAHALRTHLASLGVELTLAGLALLLRLPGGANDLGIAERALGSGVAPAPLSVWYAADRDVPAGLLLNVANIDAGNLNVACATLLEQIAMSGSGPASPGW